MVEQGVGAVARQVIVDIRTEREVAIARGQEDGGVGRAGALEDVFEGDAEDALDIKLAPDEPGVFRGDGQVGVGVGVGCQTFRLGANGGLIRVRFFVGIALLREALAGAAEALDAAQGVAHALRSLHRHRQARAQLGGIEGLGDEIGGAGAQGVDARTKIGVGGRDDDLEGVVGF